MFYGDRYLEKNVAKIIYNKNGNTYCFLNQTPYDTVSFHYGDFFLISWEVQLDLLIGEIFRDWKRRGWFFVL